MFAFMYNFFVYGFLTCIYVCMSGASGGSGAPRIGVRVVLNHQLDDGSCTLLVFSNSNKCSNCRIISSVQSQCLLFA